MPILDADIARRRRVGQHRDAPGWLAKRVSTLGDSGQKNRARIGTRMTPGQGTALTMARYKKLTGQ
jgi:hypothetical protein